MGRALETLRSTLVARRSRGPLPIGRSAARGRESTVPARPSASWRPGELLARPTTMASAARRRPGARGRRTRARAKPVYGSRTPDGSGPSPTLRAGRAFERTNDVRGDPATVETTGLRPRLFVVHKTGIHLTNVE